VVIQPWKVLIQVIYCWGFYWFVDFTPLQETFCCCMGYLCSIRFHRICWCHSGIDQFVICLFLAHLTKVRMCFCHHAASVVQMLAFHISIFSSVDAFANFCGLWKKGIFKQKIIKKIFCPETTLPNGKNLHRTVPFVEHIRTWVIISSKAYTFVAEKLLPCWKKATTIHSLVH